MTMETTMADKTDFTKYQKKDDQSNAGVAQNGTMIHELKERVKELNCFYRITKIYETVNCPLMKHYKKL